MRGYSLFLSNAAGISHLPQFNKAAFNLKLISIEKQKDSLTQVRHRFFVLNMGLLLADRAWFWCLSCIFMHLAICFLLPKRIGDKKFRLEFAQRLVSALHAVWMFFGTVDCWVRGQCTLRNGADVFNMQLSIVDFSPSIDVRIDHMLGYLIADQVFFQLLRQVHFCFSSESFRFFRHSIF